MQGLHLSDQVDDDPCTLVSTTWLAAHLNDSDLRLLDASWFLPTDRRNPRAEFEAAHIPGARFFDIEAVADSNAGLPNMAPPPALFASRMRALGLGDGQQFVIYDSAGVFSAARAWWMFRMMGKRAVAVLDGGLPKWQAEHRITTATPAPIRDRHFTVAPDAARTMDVTAVARASKLGTHTIIDARAPDRFAGAAPEPRPGLRGGHIPGAINVYFKDLLQPNGTMKPPAALRALFDAAGVDLRRPVITTCGSGVASAVLVLALERIGVTDHSLYDGSWAEWGMFADLPIAKGQS
ncbi:thiosulfate/3-mercaptopyruvate sulfurtransferase [Ketogulonicigenium robustum]|uniref:3-mercaptopyruvate sulfurtransferase n=1 Tax=Ketogulonicigenium robustum TaxID=92947 RepID=A0A1W6NWT5_9RHOB|nr:3-mercaptopyruvate sulfurtransferase [Ketogulonicigenium robustum]ARO13685.1 thiosulfate/3-mercaptopyruvate sulfurtransferase [Ketogulonicigenium robustum]